MSADDEHRRQLTRVLGDALAPVAGRIAQQLDAPVERWVTQTSIDDLIARQIDNLATCIQDIAACVDGPLHDALTSPHTTLADAWRAVGRFEACVERLIAHYLDVRVVLARGAEGEKRMLLMGALRHTLEEIARWVRDVAEALTDPTHFRRRRGLPLTGDIRIPVTLVLTPAAELSALSQWAQSETADWEAYPPRRGLRHMLGTWIILTGIVDLLGGDEESDDTDA